MLQFKNILAATFCLLLSIGAFSQGKFTTIECLSCEGETKGKYGLTTYFDGIRIVQNGYTYNIPKPYTVQKQGNTAIVRQLVGSGAPRTIQIRLSQTSFTDIDDLVGELLACTCIEVSDDFTNQSDTTLIVTNGGDEVVTFSICDGITQCQAFIDVEDSLQLVLDTYVQSVTQIDTIIQIVAGDNTSTIDLCSAIEQCRLITNIRDSITLLNTYVQILRDSVQRVNDSLIYIQDNYVQDVSVVDTFINVVVDGTSTQYDLCLSLEQCAFIQTIQDSVQYLLDNQNATNVQVIDTTIQVTTNGVVNDYDLCGSIEQCAVIQVLRDSIQINSTNIQIVRDSVQVVNDSLIFIQDNYVQNIQMIDTTLQVVVDGVATDYDLCMAIEDCAVIQLLQDSVQYLLDNHVQEWELIDTTINVTTNNVTTSYDLCGSIEQCDIIQTLRDSVQLINNTLVVVRDSVQVVSDSVAYIQDNYVQDVEVIDTTIVVTVDGVAVEYDLCLSIEQCQFIQNIQDSVQYILDNHVQNVELIDTTLNVTIDGVTTPYDLCGSIEQCSVIQLIRDSIQINSINIETNIQDIIIIRDSIQRVNDSLIAHLDADRDTSIINERDTFYLQDGTALVNGDTIPCSIQCRKSKTNWVMIDNNLLGKVSTSVNNNVSYELTYSNGFKDTIYQSSHSNAIEQFDEWEALFSESISKQCDCFFIELRCTNFAACDPDVYLDAPSETSPQTMGALYLNIGIGSECVYIASVRAIAINSNPIDEQMDYEFFEGSEIEYELCNQFGLEETLYYAGTQDTVPASDIPPCLLDCYENLMPMVLFFDCEGNAVYEMDTLQCNSVGSVWDTFFLSDGTMIVTGDTIPTGADPIDISVCDSLEQCALIKTIRDSIQANDARITVNEGDIATNSTAISNNTTLINNHIANDQDTDDQNEIDTLYMPDGTALTNGDTIPIQGGEDVTNEIDTFYLTDGTLLLSGDTIRAGGIDSIVQSPFYTFYYHSDGRIDSLLHENLCLVCQAGHGFALDATTPVLPVDNSTGQWMAANTSTGDLVHDGYVVDVIDNDCFLLNFCGIQNLTTPTTQTGLLFLQDDGSVSNVSDNQGSEFIHAPAYNVLTPTKVDLNCDFAVIKAQCTPAQDSFWSVQTAVGYILYDYDSATGETDSVVIDICNFPCDAPATCTDGIQNQDETGVDCGGATCPACETCSDGIQNQDETGIDCGGVCAPCPTCTDGIQNGDETGVDCGGSVCPACANGTPIARGGATVPNVDTGISEMIWDITKDDGSGNVPDGECFELVVYTQNPNTGTNTIWETITGITGQPIASFSTDYGAQPNQNNAAGSILQHTTGTISATGITSFDKKSWAYTDYSNTGLTWSANNATQLYFEIKAGGTCPGVTNPTCPNISTNTDNDFMIDCLGYRVFDNSNLLNNGTLNNSYFNTQTGTTIPAWEYSQTWTGSNGGMTLISADEVHTDTDCSNNGSGTQVHLPAGTVLAPFPSDVTVNPNACVSEQWFLTELVMADGTFISVSPAIAADVNNSPQRLSAEDITHALQQVPSLPFFQAEAGDNSLFVNCVERESNYTAFVNPKLQSNVLKVRLERCSGTSFVEFTSVPQPSKNW